MNWRSDRGFALVEALIGAGIIAVTLGAMYSATIASASRSRLAEDKRVALLIAQSEMASVGPVLAVQPGVTSGEEFGYTWHIAIDPYNTFSSTATAGQLWRVTVTVGNNIHPNLATLSTLALGPGA